MAHSENYEIDGSLAREIVADTEQGTYHLRHILLDPVFGSLPSRELCNINIHLRF